MKRVITTVGTSLFTNYMKREVRESQEFAVGSSNPYRPIDDGRYASFNVLQDTSAPPFGSIRAEEAYDDIKEAIRLRWLNKHRPYAAAEINSLLKIAEQEDIEVFLIATQTALSVAACELIKEYLESDHNNQRHRFSKVTFEPEKQIIKGLQVNDANLFQNEGFNKLVECIIDIKERHDDSTMLNISGGYKALIPPLTLLAQLEKIPMYYIYEDSDVAIETGVLPIQFDWSFIDDYVILLNDANKRNNAAPDVLALLRQKKLVQHDSTELTILGQLIKRYSNNASPFTQTIFGYLIEYKLHESYARELGTDKVEHSVDVKDGDIDLLITREDKSIIPVEVKPSNKLESEELTKIVLKLAERTKILLEMQPNRKPPAEVWLITYSYTEKKETGRPLSTLEKENLQRATDSIKGIFGNNVIFRVKHFYIKPNKLIQGERHIYHKFMKSRLPIKDIQDIFVAEKL